MTVEEGLLRRVDDGNLVLWRPGLTIWVSAFAGDLRPAADKLAACKQDIDPAASAVQKRWSTGCISCA